MAQGPLAEAIETALIEWAIARDALAEDLSTIWGGVLLPSFWVVTFLTPGKTIVGELFLRGLDTLDAIDEYSQDVGLIPHRAIKNTVAKYLIQPPDGWNTRVMTAADAYRWAWELFAESAIAVVDLDLPREVQTLQTAAKLSPAQEVLTLVKRGDLRLAVARARSGLKSVALGLLVSASARVLSYVGGIGILVLAERFRARMEGKEGDRALARYALSQDNPREIVRGPHRHRVNPKTK